MPPAPTKSKMMRGVAVARSQQRSGHPIEGERPVTTARVLLNVEAKSYRDEVTGPHRPTRFGPNRPASVNARSSFRRGIKMPHTKPAQTAQAHARQDVELADQYRQIGSAAILGALACKMKQAQAESDNTQKRSRQAA